MGWGRCLIRHVLNTVHATRPEVATQVHTLVARALHQGRGCKDEGLGGPEAFDDIVRVLCRGSTQATPAAVRQPCR